MKWVFGLCGLAFGIAGTLFVMHFLIAANAYDPTSVYEVDAAGEKVSCLSFSSVQKVCGVSRELLELEHILAYDQGYDACKNENSSEWDCHEKGICGDPETWDVANATLRVVT